ncbi:MAG TPA: hypothetical protein VHB51_00475 [Candidatus Saccharimonadales bacterium]|nr:hypothetical protein [Candidatus Saccharimonadales bacterium]
MEYLWLNNDRREALDRAVEIEVAVQERQWSWIEKLPLAEGERNEVFKRMCLAMGQFMDAMLDPEKAAKLLETD